MATRTGLILTLYDVFSVSFLFECTGPGGGLVRQSSNFVPVLWFRIKKTNAVLFRTEEVFQTVADLRGTGMPSPGK